MGRGGNKPTTRRAQSRERRTAAARAEPPRGWGSGGKWRPAKQHVRRREGHPRPAMLAASRPGRAPSGLQLSLRDNRTMSVSNARRAAALVELCPLSSKSAASNHRYSCRARGRPICRSCRSASLSLNGRRLPASARPAETRWVDSLPFDQPAQPAPNPPQRRRHLRKQPLRLLARGEQLGRAAPVRRPLGRRPRRRSCPMSAACAIRRHARRTSSTSIFPAPGQERQPGDLLVENARFRRKKIDQHVAAAVASSQSNSRFASGENQPLLELPIELRLPRPSIRRLHVIVESRLRRRPSLVACCRATIGLPAPASHPANGRRHSPRVPRGGP